jgi:4-hydroxy-tetrahydrodipicolinate synthase
MTFRRCVGQWLVSCISLIARLRNGGVENSDLPYTGRAGFALTVDTLEAIRDQVPHFAGLKNTDTDVAFVTGALARLGRNFRIFAGLELPTLPMLGIGGCGMMITASDVAPHLVAQLYETLVKRDIDGAIALNLKLYPLFRGVALESSPIPVKYMLKRLGVLKANEHRSPLVPVWKNPAGVRLFEASKINAFCR